MALPVPFPSGGLIQAKTGNSWMRHLWIPSSFDYDVFEDKFWGDLIRDEYPAAKTNGTSAAVTFTEHNQNGYIDLVSGTDDDGYAGQGLGMQFTGDRGILAEFLFRTPSAVTTLKFECGLSDADDDAGGILLKATPTFTASDIAVFVVDTDDDANIGFITRESDGGTSVATQDIVAVAASTTYRFAIRVEGNAVSAWLNGTQVAGGQHKIEGGTKLTPWAFCQARAGSASRTMQLHKWRVIQPAY